MRIPWLSFSLVLLSLGAGAMAAAFSVTPGQRPLAIVVPEAPNASIRTAAGELAEHLELATGVRPGIFTVGGNVPAGSFEFRLGTVQASKLTGEKLGFYQAAWQCDENALTITGNDAGDSQGTLFAVYDWLDRVLGCRWLWPGELGRVVPETKTITMETGKGIYSPALRCVNWRPLADPKKYWDTEAGWTDFISHQQQWFFRNRMFNDMALQNYPHGFENWYVRFGKTHPEYFNLLPDGTRRPDPLYENGAPTLVSICVSNPDVVRQVVQDWLAGFNPAWPQINLNENDTAGRCTCDNCLAWDNAAEAPEVRRARAKKRFDAGDEQWYRELGSVSGRYARFYLAVLAEVDRVAPERHAEIAGLIYANYNQAPDIPMNDRIYQRYCPPIMFPWTQEKMDRYRTQWQAWADTGCQMLMRPNFTLDGHCFPINYAKPFAECFRFGYPRNMVGLDMDSCTGNFSAMGTTLYTIARLTCHPEMSDAAILDEYYAAFGPAAGEVGKYFDRLAELSWQFGTDKKLMDNEAIVGGDYSKFFTVAPEVFTPEIFAELNRMLDHAAELAAADSVAAKRVAWLRLGLHHAELTVQAEKGFETYKKTGDLNAFAAPLAALDAFRAAHEHDYVSNFGFLRWLESLTWPCERVKLATAALNALPLEWRFRTDPDHAGEKEQWQSPGYDDSNWRMIATDQPWEPQLGAPYDGFGWYRIDLELPAKLPGVPVLILGAVDEACDVWCNGEKVLSRPYPYQGDTDSWRKPVKVPLGTAARAGAGNKIAVRVLDQSGAGGIWQPCYLEYNAKPNQN